MLRTAVRSLWDEPRPPRPPAWGPWDWLPLAVLIPLAVVEALVRDELVSRPAALVLFLVMVVALPWRRTRPFLAVVYAFGIAAAVTVLRLIVGLGPVELYTTAWLLLLPYSLLRWGAGREVVMGLATVLVSAALGMAAEPTPLLDAVVGLGFLAFPAALGASARYRANARVRELDQVKLREREELARELHDTVAHHVSAIAIQAQAGRTVAATDPDRAVTALEVIEEAASRTLAEMRAMVGFLRTNHDADLAPQPGVGDIERLARSAGDWPRIEVELCGDLDDLSPAIEAAVYRLAQESITNAVRHARHATRVDVRVAGDAEHVHLTVRDDGDGADGRHSWGYGLVGMTERAALLGGTLQAGPSPGRGWTVDAVLPKAGAVT
jgi:signal transduction histidine kinase